MPPHGGRVLLLLVPLAMAGCTGQGQISSQPFFVPVPEWEPGYRWTFDVIRSTEAALGGTGSDLAPPGVVEEWRETLEVFNATQTLASEPVYFAWLNTQPTANLAGSVERESYYDYRPVRVYRTSDLAFAATGTILVGGTCVDCNVLRLTDPSEAPPELLFPLEPGAAWTTVGTPSNLAAGHAIEFEYAVVGLRTVDQGGPDERRGIQVHVEGRPAEPNRLSRDLLPELVPPGINVTASRLELRFGADYYWGPAERNLVYSHQSLRVDLDVEGTDRDGGPYRLQGSFVDETIKRLVSHSLEEKPARSVPALDIRATVDSEANQLDSLYIESDRPPTVPNVAEGPVGYHLSIGSRSPSFDNENVPGGRAYAGGEPHPYNSTRFSVRWTLWGHNTRDPVTFDDAATFSFEMDRAGSYHVSAVLADRKLGLPVKTLGFDFRLDYAASNQVRAEPGLAGPLTLLRFPLDQPHGQVVLRWSSTGFGLMDWPSDEGSYVLRQPDGRTQTLQFPLAQPGPRTPNQYHFVGGPVGEYTLEWQPQLPVIIGDDHFAQASITYPSMADLHEH